jgi:hypothetical protein
MYFKNKKQFAHNLFTISRLADDELVNLLSNELMLSFIQFGSETPDNINAFDQIDYGVVEREYDSGHGKYRKYGLRLKDKKLSIADVFHDMVESLSLEDMPDKYREYYPEITPDEFRAILRITTMVLLAFERQDIELGEIGRVGRSYKEGR